MKRTRWRRAEKFPRRDFERFQRDIHRLKLRVIAADQRTKRNEAEMLIKLLLARGAGNDGEVITFLYAMLPEQRKKTGQNLSAAGAAKFPLDGEQADFANGPTRRQIRVQILQLLIEGERAVTARRQHAHEFGFFEANQVSVFRVELVHEPLRW